jgi:hypothetical protein
MIRRSLVLLLALACVLGVARAAPGSRRAEQKRSHPYFVGDFDTCDFSQWREMQGPSAAFKIIHRPKVEGRCAAALTIGPWAAGGLGSLAADGAALWFRDPPYGHVGQTVWQHFSVEFAPGFQTVPGDWNLFIEWHNDPGWKNFPAPHLEYADLCWAVRNHNGVDLLGMRIMGGPSTAPATIWVNGPRLRIGHWYDFLAHTVWSPDRKTGIVEWWLDGKKVYSRHVSTLYTRPDGSTSSVYFIADHYRRHADTTTTIRFDGFRLGPTRASVRYRSARRHR